MGVECVLCAFKEHAGLLSLGDASAKSGASVESVAEIGFFVEGEVSEGLGIVDQVKVTEALEFCATDLGLLAFVSVEGAECGERALLAELGKSADGGAHFGERVSVKDFLAVDAKAGSKAQPEFGVRGGWAAFFLPVFEQDGVDLRIVVDGHRGFKIARESFDVGIISPSVDREIFGLQLARA